MSNRHDMIVVDQALDLNSKYIHALCVIISASSWFLAVLLLYKVMSYRKPFNEPWNFLKRTENSKTKGTTRKPALTLQRPAVDLSVFPMEVKLLILDQLVLERTKTPCLISLFGDCLSEWDCKEHHFTDKKHGRDLPVTLDPKLISLSRILSHEAHMTFFENNTFLFDSMDLPWHDIGAGEAKYSELRDPRASRLLNFIDKPGWKGIGSANFIRDKSYDQIDAYRNKIQHIIFDLRYDYEFVNRFRPDWDWPLKVDWTTLPNLKTLVLDLRAYSMQEYFPTPLPPSLHSFALQHRKRQFDSKIREGAKRMGCLQLKTLTLVGLCSGPKLFRDEEHRELMRNLFEEAMHPEGEIIFRDWMHFARWGPSEV